MAFEEGPCSRSMDARCGSGHHENRHAHLHAALVSPCASGTIARAARFEPQRRQIRGWCSRPWRGQSPLLELLPRASPQPTEGEVLAGYRWWTATGTTATLPSRRPRMALAAERSSMGRRSAAPTRARAAGRRPQVSVACSRRAPSPGVRVSGTGSRRRGGRRLPHGPQRALGDGGEHADQDRDERGTACSRPWRIEHPFQAATNPTRSSVICGGPKRTPKRLPLRLPCSDSR